VLKQGDKELISTEVYTQAEDLAHLIKTHRYTKKYFSDRYQREYSFLFNITIKGVMYRGEIDYIAIDHKAKTVQIIDFKTGSDPAIDFSRIFISYRYYIQEAVYMKAFRFICKHFNLKGYNLLPFKFIYISRSEKTPVSYTVTKKWHLAALNGFTTTTGYTYRGLYELIDDIKWHFNNKQFVIPRYIYEAGGTMNINDNIIQ